MAKRTKTDPVFAQIECHRKAEHQFTKAIDLIDGDTENASPRDKREYRIDKRRSERAAFGPPFCSRYLPRRRCPVDIVNIRDHRDTTGALYDAGDNEYNALARLSPAYRPGTKARR